MSRGPLKGAMSGQKALQGSVMEVREFLRGTEEKRISPIDLTLAIFFQKLKGKDLDLAYNYTVCSPVKLAIRLKRFNFLKKHFQWVRRGWSKHNFKENEVDPN